MFRFLHIIGKEEHMMYKNTLSNTLAQISDVLSDTTKALKKSQAAYAE